MGGGDADHSPRRERFSFELCLVLFCVICFIFSQLGANM